MRASRLAIFAASIHVRSALQALPSDPELHALSGFVALAIGDLSQAQRSLLRAIALGAAEPRTTKCWRTC